MSSAFLSDEEVFQVARRIESADARRAYLDQTCRDDATLRMQVEALLIAYEASESFLESPAAGVPTRDQSVVERPGAVIGSYRLIETIGEGGFGIIFKAEQQRPVQRCVALKVIKPGMDTREVIARFEGERQALAMMDHPNIAKVFDAGTTDSRRPYFVMELVQGVPITEYCDACSLTVRERLELLITVCHAVQHAHQKGVIHRDIKPTNVLVAMQDGKPSPKIIDFGVAKALDHRLTSWSLATGFAQMIGTPLYMSPEQAELSPLGVDTRSDIYSLGVLLYELLTGMTPFEKEGLKDASYDEMRRIIREVEPLRPSVRLSTLAANVATTVAEQRRTDTRRHVQSVRGDLDWIVLKSLEKDRTRRYETANDLAQDISRYLHDEPVQAGPPSRVYRFVKFVRRNRAATLAAAAVLTGLIAAAIGASAGMVSESRRRTAAERERAAAELNLANVLQSQERYAESENLYRQSLTKSADSKSDQQEAARTRLQLAHALLEQGRIQEAEKMLGDAVIAHRRAFPPGDINTAHAINEHAAMLLNDLGRHSEAEALFREALAMFRAATPENHLELAKKLLNLGNSLAWQQKFAEAEPFYRDSIAQYERAFPPDHTTLALARLEYAFILIRLKRFPEAEAIALKSAPVLQSSPPWRLFSAAALASLYARWDEAEPGKRYDKKAREWSLKILDAYVLRGAADESRKTD
jgi:non-specific serine/threonine protein kinase/serine/threonine-protein kinase